MGVGYSQTTDHVLMIRPDHFDCNVETLADNSFMQHNCDFSVADVVASHRRFIDSMRSRTGTTVVDVFKGTAETPDGCFPNNWFSTHASSAGSYAVLYPMKAPSRRLERRAEIVEQLKRRCPAGIIDLSALEEEEDGEHFLEGTGSLVLDRVNAIAFVALSQRSHADVAARWASEMSAKQSRQWTLVSFEARDAQQHIIYHTNVMMAILERVCVVCLESIVGAEQRERVRAACESRTIVEISLSQVESFCANIIEVDGAVIMSTSAYEAFSAAQLETIQSLCETIIHHDLSLMQSVSGGGIRCCIAELAWSGDVKVPKPHDIQPKWLAEHAGIHVDEVRLEPLSGGFLGRTFKLNDTYVVKYQPTRGPFRHCAQNEQLVYSTITEGVPKLYYAADALLIVGFVEGASDADLGVGLTEKQLTPLLTALGRFHVNARRLEVSPLHPEIVEVLELQCLPEGLRMFPEVATSYGEESAAIEQEPAPQIYRGAVHGDCTLQNCLMGSEILFIDFQFCHQGIVLDDVGVLIHTSFHDVVDEQTERRLVEAHRQSFDPTNSIDAEEHWHAYVKYGRFAAKTMLLCSPNFVKDTIDGDPTGKMKKRIHATLKATLKTH